MYMQGLQTKITNLAVLQASMRYLFWFANVHVNFRLPELKSLAAFYKIPVKWIEHRIEEPYIIVELNKEEEARKLTSRSVLVRSCYELWAEGTSDEELHSNVKKLLPHMDHHISKEKDFRMTVVSFNRKLSKEEKSLKMMAFSYMPFKGKVNLTNPETVLSLIEYYGICPRNIPDKPYKSFFGRWLLDGQRELIHSFTLKKRKFIGTTSMDPELAFLMANLALIGPGSIVLDPFVGTGSILVSAAHWGAYVWGWDIDYLTLHAKTKPSRFKEKARKPNESVLCNLEQYGLSNRYLDVLVMDSARYLWRKKNLVDAIITDPPYGIRESRERVGSDKEKKRKLSAVEEEKPIHESYQIHYPPKVNYTIADIMVDLLNFAVAHLKLGGHLVFWLPVFREDYSDDLIPRHPCLRMEYNCEQILSTHTSRRLITLVKFREAEEGEAAVADELRNSQEFRKKCSEASQTLQSLSKDEKKALKKKFPMDKRGQGYIIKDFDNDSKQQILGANKVIKEINTNHVKEENLESGLIPLFTSFRKADY